MESAPDDPFELQDPETATRTVLELAQSGDAEGLEKLLKDTRNIDLNVKDETYGETPITWATELGHTQVVELLLEHHADVNIVDNTSRGPLHWAVIYGRTEIVRLLLEKSKPNVNDKDDTYGQTPISWAAENGDLEIFNFLLKHGADITIPDKEKRLPLNHASIHNHADLTIMLLGKINDNRFVDETGRSLLSWAAEYPSPRRVVAELLKYHKINDQDKLQKRTAIHYAARGGHIEPVVDLLEAGAEIHLKDKFGMTPLALAAIHGHTDVMKTLIKKGSDINSQDEDGSTPLMLAARKGHTECVRLLLQEGAEKEQRDNGYGQSALAWAAENGHLEVVKELVKFGSDIYSQDLWERTTVYFAVYDGGNETLRTLIEYEYGFGQEQAQTGDVGALGGLLRTRAIEEALWHCRSDDSTEGAKHFILNNEKYLRACDKDGRTLLSWAASRKDGEADEIVTLLLGKNASVNHHDNLTRTPLSWAAEGGNEGVVDVLLKNGAAADDPDQNRRTPLSWAAEKGHLEVVSRLLDLPPVKNQAVQAPSKEKVPMEAKHNETRERKAPKNQKRAIMDDRNGIGDRLAVNVDFVDDVKNYTPLCYAAVNGYIPVVDILLDHGADPYHKVDGWKTLVDILIEGDIFPQVRARLESNRKDGKLATVRIRGSDFVDAEFKALVVDFQESAQPYKTRTVKELLDDENSISKEKGLRCRWLHLPANNMRWVEILMAKHYKMAGTKHETKCSTVLSKTWTGHQHRTPDAWSYHARFMRPDCHRLPALLSLAAGSKREPTGQDAKQEAPVGADSETNRNVQAKPPVKDQYVQNEPTEKDKNTPTRDVIKETPKTRGDSKPPAVQDGIVLFMPYLHWEKMEEMVKLKDIMKQKQALRHNEDSSRRHAIEIQNSNLNGTEKLCWMYLDEEHSLHPRRTLDQYYYHNLDNTDERDRNQETARYYQEQETKRTKEADKAKEVKEVKEILTMVDQLWMWVLPECGEVPSTVITAFPQRSNRIGTRGRQKHTTALMDNIVSRYSYMPPRHGYDLAQIIAAECSRIYLDRTTPRDNSLQFFDIYSKAIAALTDAETNRFKKFSEAIKDSKTENVVGELIDIKVDISDLGRIKDIQDELNIMSSVFETQKTVLETMNRLISEGQSPGSINGTTAATTTSSASQEPDRLGLSSPLVVVERNIRDVQGLSHFAEKTSEAMKQLLDLKNKQANVLEEQMIYALNAKTDKQGKTLMAFTIITIVFLPLSFMASFLALNVAEFPRGKTGYLSLSFVSTYIFSISVAIILPFVVVAFNMNNIDSYLRGRLQKWWKDWPPEIFKAKKNGKQKKPDEENPPPPRQGDAKQATEHVSDKGS